MGLDLLPLALFIYHWKGSGEDETNDREKRENLYRDRTSGGNPAGIVLSYFCERTTVFSTGEGKSQ